MINKIDKYLNEQTSDAVKKLEKTMSDYWKDKQKLEKNYRSRVKAVVNAFRSYEEFDEIVNQLEFSEPFDGEVASIMAMKAKKLGIDPDWEH